MFVNVTPGLGKKKRQRSVRLKAPMADPLPYATPPPAAGAPKTFSVGTLTYTRAALFSVFFWMLWGDLCVNIMEAVIPKMLPVQLDRLGAGPTLLNTMTVSVGAGVEMVVSPIISTFSDRYRSRFGRRRPFILFATPILAFFMALLGFSENIGAALHPLVAATGLSQNQLTIAVIALLFIAFQLFNVVVMGVYYYMIADVVPRNVMGTFTCLYKVMGTLGAVIFNQFIFQYADRHQIGIYVGCALIYLVVFMFMGWRVREGEYAPPPPPSRDLISGLGTWAEECFSISFYRKLYLTGAAYWFGFAAVTLNQLFALKTLGLTKGDFGSAVGASLLYSLPLYFVIGPLADRLNPVRLISVGHAAILAAALGSFAFIHDGPSFRFWTIVGGFGNTIYLATQISLMPKLLPRSQYGQYASANGMVKSITYMLGGTLSGLAIAQLSNNYRYAYLWQAGFAFLGVIAGLVIYEHWKRLGGDDGYVSPTVERAGAPIIEIPPAPTNLSEEMESDQSKN